MFLSPALISFEGTECAGKSTAIRNTKEWLEKNYENEVVVVRVPGGTEIGMKIRSIVAGDEFDTLSDTTTALLFAADWRHTLETVVLPALERGAIVLSDRYNLSSYAMQANASDLGKIIDINNKLKTPDVVFLLTTPYDVFIQRRDERSNGENNARDYISEERHTEIRERYIQYADTHPNVCVMVDCLRDISEISKEIHRTIASRFRI